LTVVVGYVRVSTDEQGNSGLGLQAQRRALEEEAAHRGWTLLSIHEDVATGKTKSGRQGLQAALQAVDTGEADVLVAVRVDRLSRSLRDLIELMDRSVSEGWSLVTLDLRVDTTTPHGKAMARMAGVFAELERDLIAERTKAALAVKKAQGAKLGRPATMPPQVRRRIKRMHARGLGWTAIARKLNDDGVQTAQEGRQWYPSTVRSMFAERHSAKGQHRAGLPPAPSRGRAR
jgi:DNA invertase Pin-like site-specific DNA recombinase